jgi:hypothetical protein
MRARGITGDTVGKAEGASAEKLAEIRAVLESVGVEITVGIPPGCGLKSPALRREGHTLRSNVEEAPDHLDCAGASQFECDGDKKPPGPFWALTGG